MRISRATVEGMKAQIGRNDANGTRVAQAARDHELFDLGFGIDAVARLDLDRRDALGHERVQPSKGLCRKCRCIGRACLRNRRSDTTDCCHVFVARTRKSELELVDAVAAEHEMRVAIDQPGRDPPTFAVDRRRSLEGRRLATRAAPCDAPIPGRQDAIFDDAQPIRTAGHRGEARMGPHRVNACHMSPSSRLPCCRRAAYV